MKSSTGKRIWQAPALIDLTKLQATASGTVTGLAEVYCTNLSTLSTTFAPTSGDPDNVVCVTISN